MLISAFSKESENVFVDLLTYNDLEILKSRKQQSNLSSSTNSIHSNTSSNTNISMTTNTKQSLKRYIILTYSSEFDRVHFPLPLNHVSL